MNDFKLITRILQAIRQAVYSTGDYSNLKGETFGIPEMAFAALMIELEKEGYISGLLTTQTLSDPAPELVEPVRPSITLRGMAFLAERTPAKQVQKFMAAVKDSIPGL